MCILKKEYRASAVLGVLALLIIIRCFFGFDDLDEGFYLACVDRFWKGDRPIIDEWNLAQVFFLFQLPLYALYRVIVPSGEGIYLAFRLFSSAIAIATSIATFRYVVNRYSSRVAFLCAAAVLFFCRNNILGISYYGIFVYSILLALLCESKRIEREEDTYRTGLWIGFLYSLSVISMPYQMILFPCLLVYYFVKGAKKTGTGIVLGISIVVAYYLMLFAFLKTNLFECVKYLPYLLKDEEHEYGYIRAMLSAFRLTLEAITLPGCLIFAVMVVLLAWKKTYKSWIWLLAIIGMIVSIIPNIRFSDRMYVIFVFYMLPFLGWILLSDNVKKTEMKTPITLVIAGVVAALVFTSGSNMNIDALSTGMVISTIGILTALDVFYRDREMGWDLAGKAGCLLFIAVCFGQRIIMTANDRPIYHMNQMIKEGPLRGLVVSQGFKEFYLQTLEDIEQIGSEYMEERVYLAQAPSWLFVANSWKCSNSSTWGRVHLSSKMDNYYRLHPDYLPKVVIAGKTNEEYEIFSTGVVPTYIVEAFTDGNYEMIKGRQVNVFCLNEKKE